MFTRFVAFAALAGTLFAFSLSPTLALSESQQDAAIASLQSAVSSLQSKVTTLQNTVNTQTAQIADLQKKTNGITVATDTTRTDGRKYTEMTFKYLNLHIINGLGATDGNPNGGIDSTPVVNGLGNVIIGYNELRGSGQDARGGSHNLIVGAGQNYSSYGGLVAGLRNSVSDAYASVSGGYGNTAGSLCSSVSGGSSNTASGQFSSVLGGSQNAASSFYSSVAGGQFSTAGGQYASVGGGYQNTASANYSAVSAGKHNLASGQYASVSGGQFNTANNFYSTISGGLNVLETTSSGWAAGGLYSGDSPGPGVYHAP